AHFESILRGEPPKIFFQQHRPKADIRPSVELQASDLQLLTGYRHAEIGVTHSETRKDASSKVTTVGTRSSSLWQPAPVGWALCATLSKQHSPTPQNEAEHPEHGRHHVHGDEHTKHQCVVEEGRGAPIDRDRRDRLTRMCHKIE